ncbi:hypothetical protein VOLCADRAFT_88255 [Volvox carteri f. nagariensis]|uniref:Uncharacterized protein n=1 Tax=Volvox carteri f. nagariensis TaxID=3068 RepID=D8TNP6_VOLCA|nr:uncharacterized protein VOLCADRAFT_88255 [Volvox carteri f. nagariensis]EFJ51029.1 hypothetical protein VOLCADRAFT_88255 [Volvox carteri f. nagariensis]|eukprot:XP_002948041.1 hypothetical protein VOLCADRAFT_88255 [Volvox carteri f. nagariensis]
MDLHTCSERLAALGMDFGETGSMRLSVSKYSMDRRRVYEAMGAGSRRKGLELGGVITQGLTQADLFKVTPDSRSNRILITPILHPLEVPVRAMILPLRDNVAAGKIRDAVRQFLLPVLPEGSIWLQDDALYHATLYHASSHVKPIHASAEVVAEEERSIRAVCGSTCPINAVLDRVVITSTGVVVACWQVLPEGGEPALLRAALGAALPNAPPREAQMVKEPAMLHTTVARLLKPPPRFASASPGSITAVITDTTTTTTTTSSTQHLEVASIVGSGRELRSLTSIGDSGAGSGGDSGGGGGGGSGSGRRLFAAEGLETTSSSSGGSYNVTELRSEAVVAAVDALSATLCGLRAQFGEVWFIEEQDLLALALNGRYVRHVAPLTCPSDDQTAAAAA